MGRAALILILSGALVAGCGGFGESRFNPMNWFGRSVSTPVDPNATVNPLIPQRSESVLRRPRQDAAYAGSLVGEVTELLVERRPGGAIIRTTGVADYQGPFELRMVPVEDAGDGVLAYEFRAYQAPGPRGTDLSRTVTAAVWVTDSELAGIRTISVKGARNERTSRR
ncbi:hypothetical protein [Thetidibacter halocola]|uniref:Lipoprotein n=1 Tax=Thetidibacter halocola TaxID=2827239 RepID=A0A8J7WC37_9RHOB|nr:hypothetical protein [Thetidibacter halocola]MBS0122663.1 hypothetical protein [Thetidibacter halocola]